LRTVLRITYEVIRVVTEQGGSASCRKEKAKHLSRDRSLALRWGFLRFASYLYGSPASPGWYVDVGSAQG
jgi:hypothetical protein